MQLKVIATVAVLVAVAFLAGRATGPDPTAAASSGAAYNLKVGDRMVFWAGHVACSTYLEAGSPEMLCNRFPEKPRLQVAFFTDGLQVGKMGHPDAAPLYWTNRP